MKVWCEGGDVVIAPGGLRGETRFPLARVDSWDFLYELLGRRFLAFHLGHETHFVTLPRLKPEARKALLEQLESLLKMSPDQQLLDMERDNTHWEKLWEVIKQIGRYLRLFINPRAPLK